MGKFLCFGIALLNVYLITTTDHVDHPPNDVPMLDWLIAVHFVLFCIAMIVGAILWDRESERTQGNRRYEI